MARLPPALGERDDALDVEAGLAVRVDREAERLEALERFRLGGDDRTDGGGGTPGGGTRGGSSARRAGAPAVLTRALLARDESRRLAVTAGSSWRSEPAALLRGFAYSGSPASSRSALIRANSALGM